MAIAVAVVLTGAILSTATPGTADESAEVPATVEPTRIFVRSIRGEHPAEGHTFSFYVQLNTCPGPLLKLDHTTVVERPRTRSGRGMEIVTAYLFHHAHTEVKVCPPEVPVRKLVRVRTKRPATDLIFFDGSYSLPRRVWPAAKPNRSHRRNAASRSCGPATAKTLSRSGPVRIYAVSKQDQRGHHEVEVPLLFGCLAPHGHPRLLGGTSTSLAVYRGKHVGLVETKTLALAAPRVAYAKTISGVDTSTTSVVATNLRTNSSSYCSVGGTQAPNRGPSVAGIALNAGGSLAWIGEVRVGPLSAPFTRKVVACDANGDHELDSGEGIDLDSLALHGSRLTWTHSGETRTATLR